MARIRLNPDNARVLAVVGPAHGDILLATPMLASLRRAWPTARIDVLVYSGQADILEGNPDIDAVISAPKHPGFREYLRLLGRILRRYDLAISTKQTDRAIWYAVFAGRSRAAVVPPDRDAWKRWVTQAFVPYDHDTTHTVLQNASLTALLGIPFRADIRLPRLIRPGNSRAEDLPPPGTPDAPFAVLHMNPGLPHKRWTVDGWVAVATFLQRQNLLLVLTGGGADAEREYLGMIASHLPSPVVNLAGRLRFAELPALLRRCTVYVGSDTVVTHLAAAAGAPTIALFGPENPVVWGPWPRGYDGSRSPYDSSARQTVGNVTVLQSSQPCPTCRQGYCRRRSEKGEACTLMKTLEPGQVIAALERQLRATPVMSANGPGYS